MAGPLTATVDVGGPFKIETKPYNIAAKVELAKADDKPDTPALEAKPSVVKTTETPEAESAPVTIQIQESLATEKKGPNWIILSALIGLGIAAAGVTIYKKMA